MEEYFYQFGGDPESGEDKAEPVYPHDLWNDEGIPYTPGEDEVHPSHPQAPNKLPLPEIDLNTILDRSQPETNGQYVPRPEW